MGVATLLPIASGANAQCEDSPTFEFTFVHHAVVWEDVAQWSYVFHDTTPGTDPADQMVNLYVPVGSNDGVYDAVAPVGSSGFAIFPDKTVFYDVFLSLEGNLNSFVLYSTCLANRTAEFAADSDLNGPFCPVEALVPSCECAGNLDTDGDTDVFDFAIFAASFGQAVEPGTSGDFDDDGQVTVFDFAIFAEDFGCAP